ncbi:MAG TPA: hypothetical protein VFG50_09245 [Rhodothermales bacterium]|nr:hypothetical protein [Rhodothermales bacterium]
MREREDERRSGRENEGKRGGMEERRRLWSWKTGSGRDYDDGGEEFMRVWFVAHRRFVS